MRHGHKSNGKLYSGHKAHVAVEVTSPAEPDGEQVQSLLEESSDRTARPVEEALGDCAYSTRAAIAQAHEAQVELRTKMPSLRKGGRYGPADFRVSGDGKIAHCPAGAASVEVKRRGKGHLHLWSAEICGSCPLKAVCTTAARRTLAVAPDFHDRRERERYARSEDGRQRLRERMAAEHAIGRLKNLGAGTARRCGRAKTKAQWLWSAAVANLSLIWGSDVARDGGCPHPTVALRRARAAMYALFRRHVRIRRAAGTLHRRFAT